MTVEITSLSHESRGVARVNGKTVFVDGGLVGERVVCEYTRRRAIYDEARVLAVESPAATRVDPRCQFFGQCGGCRLQHMQHTLQIAHKQSVLLEHLARIGKVTPASVMAATTGPLWGYRHKMRLGVKYVDKKSRVLVGFREKHTPFITDMTHCEVISPKISSLLEPLQSVLTKLSVRRRIPQIEVAVGGDDVIALVIRHLADLSDDDKMELITFGAHHQLRLYLQRDGLDSVVPLGETIPKMLFYTLPEFDVTLEFQPTDFTQINPEINRAMVSLAIDLLGVDKTDRVIDLFCGIGNFTLPLARRAAKVVGVEGDSRLVRRATHNASLNKIDNVLFQRVNLTDDALDTDFLKGHFNKLLLDPTRHGAEMVITKMDCTDIERIVYVSCNTSTLARDAGILVNNKGFRLAKVGVIDMFPHTAHVESIAVFTREKL